MVEDPIAGPVGLMGIDALSVSGRAGGCGLVGSEPRLDTAAPQVPQKAAPGSDSVPQLGQKR